MTNQEVIEILKLRTMHEPIDEVLLHCIAVLQEAIDQAKPNNFERWKAGLTIEDASQLIDGLRRCSRCPVFDSCEGMNPNSCAESFKEWGEQHE